MADGTATERDGYVLPGPPSAEVRALVRATCRRLFTAEEDFIGNFRTSLAQLVPELRNTTPGHTDVLAEVLAQAVLWAGLTTEPPEVVEDTFHRLGAEYDRRGFPSSGYQAAGHAFLRAARDTQIADWSTELSSAWVACYSWLAAHLAHGAEQSQSQAEPTRRETEAPYDPLSRPVGEPLPAALGWQRVELSDDPRGAAVGGTTAGTGSPASLDEVLDLLRSKYFAGDERAVGAIVTRVALRTGADLRAPRPDQRTDPVVIANVIAVLRVMGYATLPGGSHVTAPDAASPPRQAPRARWWRRRRAGLSRG